MPVMNSCVLCMINPRPSPGQNASADIRARARAASRAAPCCAAPAGPPPRYRTAELMVQHPRPPAMEFTHNTFYTELFRRYPEVRARRRF
jgi:hypothetical protein